MSVPQKKYKMSGIKDGDGDHQVIYQESFFRNGGAWITSHRNLSQLGTCYGPSYDRGMIFGDSLSEWNNGKWITQYQTKTYGDVGFPNKLVRFVRS